MARRPTGEVIRHRRKRGWVYALRFRAYGKRRYLTLGTSAEGWDQQRAEDELQNVLADVRRGTWRPSEAPVEAEEPLPEPTFHEFTSEWLEAHRHEWRERTVEDYKWALSNHLLHFFARHGLSEITVEEIDRYRSAKVREGTLSASSINKTIARLAQILDVAVEYGHLEANPARGRRRRLRASPPRRGWLTPDQVRALLDAAEKDRALLATAVLAGLRVGELVALRWRDIDLAGGRLAVRQSKTAAGVREIALSPELRDDLAAHKASSRSSRPADHAFLTSHGTPQTPSNVRRHVLRPALRRANEKLGADGVPPLPNVTMHDLRRTFCSLLLEAGATVPYVMDQAGHTDPQVTLRIYSQVLKRSPDIGKRVDALLSESASDPVEDAPKTARSAERVPA